MKRQATAIKNIGIDPAQESKQLAAEKARLQCILENLKMREEIEKLKADIAQRESGMKNHPALKAAAGGAPAFEAKMDDALNQEAARMYPALADEAETNPDLMEKAKMNHTLTEKAKMNHALTEKAKMNHALTEKAKMNHTLTEAGAAREIEQETDPVPESSPKLSDRVIINALKIGDRTIVDLSGVPTSESEESDEDAGEPKDDASSLDQKYAESQIPPPENPADASLAGKKPSKDTVRPKEEQPAQTPSPPPSRKRLKRSASSRKKSPPKSRAREEDDEDDMDSFVVPDNAKIKRFDDDFKNKSEEEQLKRDNEWREKRESSKGLLKGLPEGISENTLVYLQYHANTININNETDLLKQMLASIGAGYGLLLMLLRDNWTTMEVEKIEYGPMDNPHSDKCHGCNRKRWLSAKINVPEFDSDDDFDYLLGRECYERMVCIIECMCATLNILRGKKNARKEFQMYYKRFVECVSDKEKLEDEDYDVAPPAPVTE